MGEQGREDFGIRAERAFRATTTRCQGSFDAGYLEADYDDPEGRFAEVRLLRDFQDPSRFTLNANIGDGRALLALKRVLNDHGIFSLRLVCHDADDEIQRLLHAESAW